MNIKKLYSHNESEPRFLTEDGIRFLVETYEEKQSKKLPIIIILQIIDIKLSSHDQGQYMYSIY